jgi:hypothetical protein
MSYETGSCSAFCQPFRSSFDDAVNGLTQSKRIRSFLPLGNREFGDLAAVRRTDQVPVLKFRVFYTYTDDLHDSAGQIARVVPPSGQSVLRSLHLVTIEWLS